MDQHLQVTWADTKILRSTWWARREVLGTRPTSFLRIDSPILVGWRSDRERLYEVHYRRWWISTDTFNEDKLRDGNSALSPRQPRHVLCALPIIRVSQTRPSLRPSPVSELSSWGAIRNDVRKIFMNLDPPHVCIRIWHACSINSKQPHLAI